MTDRDALFAAIHAAPEDDAPRLILADWLDENGEPERAEFIRIQVAQRREFEANGRTDRLEHLFIRARALFYQPWAEPVRATFGRGIAMYSRGFPKYFGTAIPVRDLLKNLTQVATWAAPETHVRVVAEAGQFKHLAAAGELRWFGRLTVELPLRSEEPLPESEILDLLASPNLVGLRQLSLARLGLTDESARAVADAPALSSLVALDLSGNQIGRAGGVALARSENLSSLRELDLAGNRVGNVAARALLHSRAFAALERLDLSGNRLTPEVRKLVEVRYPPPPSQRLAP